MLRITVATSFALLLCSPSSALSQETLGEWLAKNDPLVIAYLQSLTPDKIGRTVPGVKLTDGTQELKGYVYRGRVLQDHDGTHAYRFALDRHRAKYDVHYIWIDADAEPLAGPNCAGTWIEPGGYAVLSGDVYTQGRIGTGALVVTTCRLDLAHKSETPQ